MKKNLTTYILMAVFVVGLSILLYPTVADYINSINQSRAIMQYGEGISNLSAVDYEAILQAAREYNERLSKKPNRYFFTEEEMEEYLSLLSPAGTGKVFGVLEIPAIKVRLPIYHGTSEAVLQIGIGHIEGTSLPVGGVGTHAALSGHRGLPSATLLSELDRIVIGDIITVTILDELLTYEVGEIFTWVDPDNMSDLGIDSSKDYLTLVTCMPYGVNSHRLLVRGHRIDNEYAESISHIRVPADARQIESIYVAPIVAAPMILFLLLYLLIKYRTPKNKGS